MRKGRKMKSVPALETVLHWVFAQKLMQRCLFDCTKALCAFRRPGKLREPHLPIIGSSAALVRIPRGSKQALDALPEALRRCSRALPLPPMADGVAEAL